MDCIKLTHVSLHDGHIILHDEMLAVGVMSIHSQGCSAPAHSPYLRKQGMQSLSTLSLFRSSSLRTSY